VGQLWEGGMKQGAQLRICGIIEHFRRGSIMLEEEVGAELIPLHGPASGNEEEWPAFGAGGAHELCEEFCCFLVDPLGIIEPQDDGGIGAGKPGMKQL